jgi:hypothetical protein
MPGDAGDMRPVRRAKKAPAATRSQGIENARMVHRTIA